MALSLQGKNEAKEAKEKSLGLFDQNLPLLQVLSLSESVCNHSNFSRISPQYFVRYGHIMKKEEKIK